MHNTANMTRRSVRTLIWLALPAIILLVGAAAGVAAGRVARPGGSGPDLYLPAILKGSTPASVTDTLADGDVVTGPDGVALGAVSGALSAPVQVALSQTSAPNVPLLANAAPVGAYYQIKAGSAVQAAPDTPFLVGLPVPQGTLTDTLAVAGLLPPEQILDHGGADPAWFPMLGAYDAGREMFFTLVTGLTEAGVTYVLVNHPDLAPLQPALAGASPNQPSSAAFRVDCVGFGSPAECTVADEEYVKNRLDLDYGQIVTGMGYNPPLLKQFIVGLDPLSGLPTVESFPEYYDIFIQPIASCPNFIGQFVPADPALLVCKDPAASLSGPTYERTIRHEFYHAVQFNYDVVYDNPPQDTWVMEGPASAAELSNTTMHRTPDFPLHPVDVSLIADPVALGNGIQVGGLLPYQTQDFWVFLGQKDGKGLEYLKDQYAQGAKTQDVADVFGDGQTISAYWDWAKNQAMEPDIDLDGALGSPCELEANLVTAIEDFHHEWLNHPRHEVAVEPLNTIVVQIHWDFDYDFADGWVYASDPSQLPGALQALEYKFYEEGESGCQGIPDGRRTWLPADGGISKSKTYYVIISNTDIDDTYLYTIAFELSPLPPN